MKSILSTNKDFLLDVSRGKYPGCSIVTKFGRNTAVGTTIVPVCAGGVYRTPVPSAAATLEVISDDADDTAAGAGAREITLQYLDATGVEQTGTIATNGTTASTETVAGVWRLLRAYVSSSGTYATQSAASQQGTITIRVAGAGATWTELPVAATGFGLGQSLIGSYTIPLGKTGYIFDKRASIDSTKVASLYFFKRLDAGNETPPFTGTLRVQNAYAGLGSTVKLNGDSWVPYAELTDLGYLAKVPSSTADISVEFEILLIDNDFKDRI